MDPIAISLFLFLILVFLGEILLLITPVDLSLEIERFNDQTEFISIVSFGALQFRTDFTGSFITNEILIAGRRLHCFSGKEMDGSEKEEKNVRPDPDIRSLKHIVGYGPGLLQDFLTLLGKIIHEFTIRSFELNIRLGFSSSALTGIIFGYFSALKAVLSPVERLQIAMNPIFGEEVLEGRVFLLLRVRYPIRVLVAIFRFLLGRNMRRFLLDMGREMHRD
jgi:hypothetical protein